MNKCFNKWREYVEGKKKTDRMHHNAEKFHQYQLMKKSFESLFMYKKIRCLSRYKNNLASHFYMQKAYEKLVAAVCASLAKRHKTVQAIRHYANNVSSFLISHNIIVIIQILIPMEELHKEQVYVEIQEDNGCDRRGKTYVS